MRVIINFIVIITMISIISCSSDDNECPDIITISSQEDLELAERCGLSPAEPLGEVWVSENYQFDKE